MHDHAVILETGGKPAWRSSARNWRDSNAWTRLASTWDRQALKILRWSHFVPADDKWFNNTYTKDWGARHGTEVIVDNINLGLIPLRAAAEISAQKGHDLMMFRTPPSVYEE